MPQSHNSSTSPGRGLVELFHVKAEVAVIASYVKMMDCWPPDGQRSCQI
jgi:hypothetical protein